MFVEMLRLLRPNFMSKEFISSCRSFKAQLVLRHAPSHLGDALPAHGALRGGSGQELGLAAPGEHCLGLRNSRGTWLLKNERNFRWFLMLLAIE